VASPAEFIFFKILRELYDAISHELTAIDTWTNEIESKVFKGKEKEMVRSLSDAGRVLIDFKRTLQQHQEILNSLVEFGKRTNNENLIRGGKEILIDYGKIMHIIDSQHEIVQELRETNNALLNTEQSEIGKVLTILAFIAVPLSLVISLFQIDFKSRPIVGMENDFWIVIGIVAILGALMFAFFRYEKWL
jgi:magnesium transporter